MLGPARAAAQPVIDVTTCARYAEAARAKRAALDRTGRENGEGGEGGERDARRNELTADIEILDAALELCSDYFHMQADYLALRRRCPDAD